MSKYINAKDLFNQALAEAVDVGIYQEDGSYEGIYTAVLTSDLVKMANEMSSADVVEVEPMLKRIKADLEEAKECYPDCENEIDKSFQQGRIFAHNYDLIVIERILSEKGEKQNEMYKC